MPPIRCVVGTKNTVLLVFMQVICINPCMLGNFLGFFGVFFYFLFKLTFLKIFYHDPDQARQFVWTDLAKVSNCLQNLSADDASRQTKS